MTRRDMLRVLSASPLALLKETQETSKRAEEAMNLAVNATMITRERWSAHAEYWKDTHWITIKKHQEEHLRFYGGSGDVMLQLSDAKELAHWILSLN